MRQENEVPSARTVDDIVEAYAAESEEGPASPDALTLLGEPVSFAAVTNGDLEGLNLLLEAGADIEATGEDGDTLLHHAIRMGDFEIARYLVERGARVDVRNADGKLARDYCWAAEWPRIFDSGDA